ncbi:L-rhamnose mutarotase [Tunturibacter empetritectus]|uniref:L-rhamnose mutarotase n=1 Tax=Tunturiibacter empetritectus TaxID=3069691 RepID=A0A7W8IGZ3_9BACT|nr:L-rhamnose mutarotase [Edaphobacter lichenicola]MBB5316837.1 L-rhamnose mutarotase [Edaphobacter lichenicola]
MTNPMNPEHPTKQRVCFLLQVKPDRLHEYRRRHAAVWPDMIAALQRTGWHNYSLFLTPSGQLIGYLETNDFQLAQTRMRYEPINALWQSEMKDFFVQTTSKDPDQLMSPLDEVFHID